MRCLPCKRTTVFLHLQLEENLDVRDGARKVHTSGFAELLGKDHNRRAILGGKTDDYGVTRCDTRMLQVSRGVKTGRQSSNKSIISSAVAATWLMPPGARQLARGLFLSPISLPMPLSALWAHGPLHSCTFWQAVQIGNEKSRQRTKTGSGTAIFTKGPCCWRQANQKLDAHWRKTLKSWINR